MLLKHAQNQQEQSKCYNKPGSSVFSNLEPVVWKHPNIYIEALFLILCTMLFWSGLYSNRVSMPICPITEISIN